MKKLIILTALILTPLTMMSQNNTPSIVNDVTVLSQIDTNTTVVSNIRNHTYFASQKEAIKLNHKKSLQITSIKAFRKAAHIKSRDTNRC